MQKILQSIGINFFIFITGAAGLIYQVTWQKYLSRLLGSDSVATAVILATFLGGLSLGYYLCGKITTRVNRHFAAYAILEGVIGLWCAAFPFVFGTVERLTQYWSFSPPAAIVLQGVLCSALLIAVPTICMGATVPFLTRGISMNLVEATRVHANVYAVNTAGAFVGTLLAGFYLIPRFGLPATMIGTSALNFAAFGFFLVLPMFYAQAGPEKPSRGAVDEIPPETPVPGKGFPAFLLYSIAFLSGFYVMSLENVLIRITNLSLGSSSYSFSIIVSVFILSIAAGSFVVGRFENISKRVLYVNQVLVTVSLAAIFLTLDKWPYWAHLLRISFQSNIAGFRGFYVQIFLALALILILPVGFMGATIPIIFHELKQSLKTVGKHSGMILSWNTAGNLIGSLVGGIVLYYALNIKGVFLTAAALAALSACLAAWKLSKKYLIPTALLFVVVGLMGASPSLFEEKNFMTGTFRIRTPLNFSFTGAANFFEKLNASQDLLYYKDGPAATVAVTRDRTRFPLFDKKSMALFVNGKSDSSTIGDIYTVKLLAHLPALLAEKRKNVMVVGLGTGVTAGELTLYPDVERIDVAEISPSVVEALPLFREFTYDLHKDPRYNIHIGDAFRVIGRSRKKWDIVISEPSNPWVTGVDSLFSKDFYRLVKNHLTEKGVLMQWAHTIISSPEMIAMILNTVGQEFKHSRVFLGGSDLLILASNVPVTCDNLRRAESDLTNNAKLRQSLQEIGVSSMASLLIKERWTPSYIADYFSDAGIQSLDHPKLHYMAGQNFFYGKNLPLKFFLNTETTAYMNEYLFYQQCENWQIASNEKKSYMALLESTRSRIDFETMLPITKALLHRGYLSDPKQYPLSRELLGELRDDLLTFVARYPESEKEWAVVGLEGASIRAKAEPLLEHVQNFRNWMVPYPLDGIVTLLQKGVFEGRDANEKNWCALQLALLLTRERVEKSYIDEILDNTVKTTGGEIILEENDRHLLKKLGRPTMTTDESTAIN